MSCLEVEEWQRLAEMHHQLYWQSWWGLTISLHSWTCHPHPPAHWMYTAPQRNYVTLQASSDRPGQDLHPASNTFVLVKYESWLKMIWKHFRSRFYVNEPFSLIFIFFFLVQIKHSSTCGCKDSSALSLPFQMSAGVHLMRGCDIYFWWRIFSPRCMNADCRMTFISLATWPPGVQMGRTVTACRQITSAQAGFAQDNVASN